MVREEECSEATDLLNEKRKSWGDTQMKTVSGVLREEDRDQGGGLVQEIIV